ncbi:unnamed protein product, partial [Musa textilis]
ARRQPQWLRPPVCNRLRLLCVAYRPSVHKQGGCSLLVHTGWLHKVTLAGPRLPTAWPRRQQTWGSTCRLLMARRQCPRRHRMPSKGLSHA